MPIVAPCGGLPLSRIFSSTVMTLSLLGSSSSLAEAMLRTGCSCACLPVFNTTYLVVDLLATMTCAPGSAQPLGAVGLNMPIPPNTARITTPTTTPGTSALSGLGAPSSEPAGEGWRKDASVRRFAKV